MGKVTREVLKQRTTPPPSPEERAPSRFKQFLYLFILVVVWGGVCFMLGMVIGAGNAPPEVTNLVYAIIDFLHFVFGGL